MTILEGLVRAESWDVLRQTYLRMGQDARPEGLVESFLIQDKDQPELWRICTVWANTEALQAMRAKQEVPTGVLIFREIGVEPSLHVFHIHESFE